MSEGTCPNAEAHTPAPEGYIAWHSWAKTMSKTHRQVKCPSCGLFAIWEPKPDRQPAERETGEA